MYNSADLEQINRVATPVKSVDDIDRLCGQTARRGERFPRGLYPYFTAKGRAVTIEFSFGEYVVTIGPAKKDNIWINVALLIATLCTTTVVGAMLYGVDPFAAPLDIYRGLPFSIAIMLVLGCRS